MEKEDRWPPELISKRKTQNDVISDKSSNAEHQSSLCCDEF